MHIGFITPEYPHANLPSSGGLGTSIKNLAEALIKEGVEVTIFVVGTESQESFTENSIRFYFIKKFKIPGFTWFFTRKYYQSVISKIAEKENIDLLEAPDWTGITAFMSFNIPLVIRCHGSDAYFCYLEDRKQKWKNFWFEKNALVNAQSVFATSRFTGKLTKQVFNLKKEVLTAYNGIDVNVFKPSNIKMDKNSILYFGTIIRKKGVFELAKTFNILKHKNPDVVLKLIGKDSNDIFQGESSLDCFYKLIEPSFIKDITYHSHMGYKEIKEEISKANVIVLPSFAEAFPMTWLEAMAMEKALVTSNIGWAKELMLDGETGFTVDPKDHDTFAKKINILLKDQELNQTFGKNARKRIEENFSSDLTTRRNIKYYQSLLK